MAELFGFFNAKDTDVDKSKYTYEAEDFSRLFKGMFIDGVFANFGEEFRVTPLAFEGGVPRVSVAPGKIWIDDKWYINTASLMTSLRIAPSSLPRIDTIIAHLNRDARAFSIYAINGAPSDNPVHVPDADLPANSYRIADITIPANATSIDQSNINYLVGKDGGAPYITGLLQGGSINNYTEGWEQQFFNWMSQVEVDFEELMQRLIDDLSGDDATHLWAAIHEIEAYLNALGNAENWSY